MRKVREIFGMRPQVGDAGVEIEVEGRRLPVVLEKYWRVERDGSLRGPENWEYVMQKPASLEGVGQALRFLDDAYQDCDSEVHETVRAGVHVHINCQQMNMVQVYNMIVLYMTLEELMVEYCGEFRQGNLFCLRAKDAEYLPMFLAGVAQQGRWDRLYTDKVRYGSLNVASLRKYGSLEFRAMRGTRDLEVVHTWTDMLLRIREAACKFKTPDEVISAMSLSGPVDFIRDVLGDKAGELLQFDDIERKVYEGVRISQEVAFATQWHKFFKGNEPQEDDEDWVD